MGMKQAKAEREMRVFHEFVRAARLYSVRQLIRSSGGVASNSDVNQNEEK